MPWCINQMKNISFTVLSSIIEMHIINNVKAISAAKKAGGDFNTYIKAMNNSSDPIWHAGQLLNKGLDSVGIGKGINNILLWTVKKTGMY